VTSENPIEQEQPTPNASGEPDKHTGEPQPAVTPAQTKSKPEPVPHKCDIACNKKRDWIDKTTLGLEGFGLFVLIVYTIFTGLMYCSNKKAAEGAKSAADTAAKQLEMSERPWVVEDFAVSGPLLFMPNGNATITIQSTIRNVGHSVAVDVQDYIAGFPEEFGNFTKVEDEQKEMCDRMRDRPKLSKTGSGAILFPGGEPYVADNTLTFSKESIMKARLPRGKEFAPEILSFVIYGCVNYGFTFSKEHHQTGFAYKVIRPPLGGLTIGSRSIKLGQNLPASELAIRRYPFAGFYID
jgi:hypothetical protein